MTDISDVFKKRPGHVFSNQPVERKMWGDTAGVGPAVQGVASALGDAIIHEAIGKIPGGGFGARLLRGTLRRSYGKYRYSGGVKRTRWSGANRRYSYRRKRVRFSSYKRFGSGYKKRRYYKKHGVSSRYSS